MKDTVNVMCRESLLCRAKKSILRTSPITVSRETVIGLSKSSNRRYLLKQFADKLSIFCCVFKRQPRDKQSLRMKNF